MKRRVVSFIVFSLFLTLQTETARSSMVLRMSFQEIVSGAELIVDGEVLKKETRLSSMGPRPFTYFKIAIIDIVKGEYPDETIEIGYMGGQVGDLVLKVSDLRMPAVGERGIYFIESLGQRQIHPLIGWQQGHYRVIVDPQTGQERAVSEYERDSGTGIRAPLLQQGTDLSDFKKEIRGLVKGDH